MAEIRTSTRRKKKTEIRLADRPEPLRDRQPDPDHAVYDVLFAAADDLGGALGFFDYSPVRRGGAILGLGGDNPFVGLDNYKAMFDQSQPARVFRLAVKNTFIFAFLVLPFNLAITLPLAVLVESVHERLKGLFRAIYFLPTISSAVAVAIMWGYIFHPQPGLLNTLIKVIGLAPPKSWLTDPSAIYLGIPLAMIAVIIAYLWQDFGYNLVIFIAALQGIPQEIQDAASVDGANAWQSSGRSPCRCSNRPCCSSAC